MEDHLWVYICMADTQQHQQQKRGKETSDTWNCLATAIPVLPMLSIIRHEAQRLPQTELPTSLAKLTILQKPHKHIFMCPSDIHPPPPPPFTFHTQTFHILPNDLVWVADTPKQKQPPPWFTDHTGHWSGKEQTRPPSSWPVAVRWKRPTTLCHFLKNRIYAFSAVQCYKGKEKHMTYYLVW